MFNRFLVRVQNPLCNLLFSNHQLKHLDLELKSQNQLLELQRFLKSLVAGGPSRKFWALSPLDGGSTCGDQYVVPLSLIEDGEVVLGVLACPNYPMRKDWDSGKAWIQPLLHVNKKFVWPNRAKQVSVSSIDNLALATFCQQVEKANSSHSFVEGLAHSVGLRCIFISSHFNINHPLCLLTFYLV
ncbi:PAP-specific phosphatase HAL2 [Spatholobus suberectus]|nr:PAP-specific phosphatase HAL2 [Spatholobus suberectus]